MPHGYAVAWGLVVDLVLSHLKLGFSSDSLRNVTSLVENTYGRLLFDCKDYPQLIDYMTPMDKKNAGDGTIAFTLLRKPGDVDVSCTATPEEISTALDIFRDLLHI